MKKGQWIAQWIDELKFMLKERFENSELQINVQGYARLYFYE